MQICCLLIAVAYPVKGKQQHVGSAGCSSKR